MKTIVVLGTHRSATSLIARGLKNEIHMGEHLLMNLLDNPLGHCENIEIIVLNNKILEAAGGTYLYPPTEENILKAAKKFENEMKQLIEKETRIAKSKNLQSWGFKDPRTCLTIKAWLPFLENPQFVVCYRNVYDTSKSLVERDGLSFELAKNLTEEYIRRINKFINEWIGVATVD